MKEKSKLEKSNIRKVNFLIFFVFCVSCINVHAQYIKYTYDASGNCTARTYQATSQASMVKSATTSSEEVSSPEISSSTNEIEQMMLNGENSIKVYPNPNNGQFKVEIIGFNEYLSKGLITIYTSQGKAILKINSLQQITDVNISNHSNGIYIMQIIIGNKSYSHKIIVSK